MARSSTEKETRTRAWVFVVYPESAPEDWRDQLEQLAVPACISPLHDQDINPTGEPKKAHYHVLLTFAGMKSFSQIKTITDRLNAPIPLPCMSTQGTVRYFLHLDNPEKHQYSRDDIVTLGGFDVGSAFEMGLSQLDHCIDELIDFVEDNDVYEFCDLVRLVRLSGRTDWREVLTRRCSVFFSAYLRSRAYKYQQMRQEADDDV